MYKVILLFFVFIFMTEKLPAVVKQQAPKGMVNITPKKLAIITATILGLLAGGYHYLKTPKTPCETVVNAQGDVRASLTAAGCIVSSEDNITGCTNAKAGDTISVTVGNQKRTLHCTKQ